MLCIVVFFVILLGGVSSAQLSPACSDDLTALLNSTILLGEASYNVRPYCSYPFSLFIAHKASVFCRSVNTTAACQNTTQQIGSLVLLTNDITKIVQDCFKAVSAVCQHRLSVLNQDIASVAQDAVQVSSTCNTTPLSSSCNAAIENLSADVSRVVVDIVSTVSICSSSQQSVLSK